MEKTVSQMFSDWMAGREPDSESEAQWRIKMEEENERLINTALMPF